MFGLNRWSRRAATAARVSRMLLLVVLSLLGWGSAQATSYVYDSDGRLRAAIAPSGDSTEYLYDALGNLLSVNAVPAGTLSIFAFSPGTGPVGTSVTIDGQAFTNSLTVQFNGTPASYSFVSATRIVATVPSGATTGQITIQVGASNTSSFDNFIVSNTATGAAPTITGFAPAVADTTSTITVSGTHFSPSTGVVQAGVGSATSLVTPQSDTQLTFPILPQTTSGLVGVTTQFGSAQSAQPLIVVPASVGAANVVASTVLSVGGSAQSLNIGTAGKVGAAVFYGTTNQWLSLQFSQFTSSSGSLNLTLYDPLGYVVSTQTLSTSRWSAHLPMLLASGWYTVVLAPGTGATAQVSMALESNTVVTSKPAVLNVATSVSTQSKRVVFNAAAGENLGLAITNLSVVGDAYNDVIYQLYDSSGTMWTSGTCATYNNGCDYNLSNAPLSGFYTLLFIPDRLGGTFSLTASLSDDVAVSLPQGTPVQLSTTVAGQNGRYTFSAQAGVNATIALTGISTSPSHSVTLTVYDPTGTSLSTKSAAAGANWSTFNFNNLKTSGTYQLFVDPGVATVSMTAQLATVPSCTLTNGGSTSVSTTLNGQTAYCTFNATLGENLGFGLSNVSVVGDAYNDVSVQIYNSVGTIWKSGLCATNGSGCDFNLSNVPKTDTYTVSFASDSLGGTFGLTASLSDDRVVSLPSGGAATPLSTTLSGQNGRYTFSAQAGANATIALTGISTNPANRSIALTVYDPNGASVNSKTAAAGSTWYTFNLSNLQTSGTYQLFVDPGVPTAGMNAQLATGPSGTMTVGSPVAVSTTLNGQAAYFTFSATQGQNLHLTLSNLSVYGDAYNDVSVQVYNSVGTIWNSGLCATNGSGCDIALNSAPRTDTYTVMFYADILGGTFSLSALLH